MHMFVVMGTTPRAPVKAALPLLPTFGAHTDSRTWGRRTQHLDGPGFQLHDFQQNFSDWPGSLNYVFIGGTHSINSNQLMYKCILGHILFLIWVFMKRSSVCLWTMWAVVFSITSRIWETVGAVVGWPVQGCLSKSKTCSPYSWLTPKALDSYISLLAFDLISPFGWSDTIFIFMDLLKANFPTTYNVMRRFIALIKKISKSSLTHLDLPRHSFTCHHYPILLGPAPMSLLYSHKCESTLGWHPDGEAAQDLFRGIADFNKFPSAHQLF